MKRAIILPALVTAFVALPPAAAALATPSPNGPGQPNVTSGENGVGLGPHGFTDSGNPNPTFSKTTGFANAETHYAGSDGTPSLQHSQSGNAVS
jgi:hypothetical protein